MTKTINMTNSGSYRLLKKGDRVGLITPASFITMQKLETAVQNMNDLGLEAYYLKSVMDKYGYLAGKDKDRADELHHMYRDRSVKAILCVRGGYGTTRLLDLLDYELIKSNPKPLIGFSDITALLSAIYKKTHLPGFHGIVGALEFTQYTKDQFSDLFLNDKNEIGIKHYGENENNKYLIHSGKAEGILTGGNLSLLVSLLGTKYDFEWKDKIVFIEEVNEAPYKIDRMLTHLYLAGKFKNIKGVILGNFNKCEPENFEISKEDSFNLKEVIRDRFFSMNVPSVYGFSFGHIKHQAIFPFGIHVEFDADNFQILFKKQHFKDFF